MSSRRPESSASTSASRPPLESLIYSVIPSLAPTRRQPQASTSGRISAAASGPGPGTGSSSRPTSRATGDDPERRARVEELVEFSEVILASRLPSSAPVALNTLPDHTRRLLSRSGASSRIKEKGKEESAKERALRFNALWNKLEQGRTLASPLPHLQFLLALSAFNPAATDNSMPPPSVPTFPSTRTKPTASGSSSRIPLSEAAHAKANANAVPEWTGPGKGKSKAEVLKAWRVSRARPPFPQNLLLRDALYLLQGIDGRYVRFAVRAPKEENPYLTSRGRAGDGVGFPLGKAGIEAKDEDEGDEVIGLDFIANEKKDGYISLPDRTVVTQISEMGVLYRKVTTFIKDKDDSAPRRGMIEQSLCHFLHHELSEYHRLLAVLESQMSLSAPSSGGEGDTDRPAEGSGLTLLRLGLWTEDMKIKMKMMAQIVDDALVNQGGALVSLIHAHTSHGDPTVRNFMEQVLEEVSKPFFSTLQRWIFSGELHDPFQEFFVQLNPETSSAHHGRLSPYQTADIGFEGGMDSASGTDEAHKVWEKKYVLVKGMKPGFVSEDFGKKIFSTGRSLNFIRYSCHDSDWIETQAKLANAGRALKYSDLAGLERSIDDAYSIASKRLLEIFFDKFSLLEHLRALKSYLMLGAGDFAELLMEALAPRLSKPAASLYRHHLTSDLESAIRGSNAQYDSPDVLRRLDARVLEYSPGEIGWDCFALEYKIEAPLNAVLDGRAMVEYDRLFHHLWRLKRVESALTQGWMRVTSNSRHFEGIQGLGELWHSCRALQAQMVHFLRNLQAFCQLEVIECSWQSLLDFTDKQEGDLDALIAAHRKYLDRLVRKVLLLGSKRDKEEILLDLVREALDMCLGFRSATDDLYAWSLSEATRLDRLRDDSRGIAPASHSDARSGPDTHQLTNITKRIMGYRGEWKSKLDLICQLAGGHQDLDVRFLAIRLAFNGFYVPKKIKSSKSVRG